MIPTVGETDTNIWIRIYLSAEDEDDLEGTSFMEILPDFGKIEITGYPDARINVDGALRSLPTTIKSLKNLQRIIQVPEFQKIGNNTLLFKSVGRWI